jgi:hypothetical protein
MASPRRADAVELAPVLDQKPKLVLTHGRNGTGKSTVIRPRDRHRVHEAHLAELLDSIETAAAGQLAHTAAATEAMQ